LAQGHGARAPVLPGFLGLEVGSWNRVRLYGIFILWRSAGVGVHLGQPRLRAVRRGAARGLQGERIHGRRACRGLSQVMSRRNQPMRLTCLPHCILACVIMDPGAA
jgi:hypothetical protein